MKKFLFIAAFLCILFTVAKAQQTGASFQNFINVGTTPPEVASIGKFGNIPVNYNSGTSGLTIPVYEINIGSIKLPISFDYNTSGVRVDEVSSSVGLGWSLSGIGVISRNVVGLPDEDGGGYLYSPSFDSLYNDWIHAGGQYGAAVDNQYAQFLLDVRNGVAETEPDIFSYVINGQSGKFIFRKDHSIVQIPHSNVQIIQIGSGYKITDEKGIVYIFDQIEHTQDPRRTLNYPSSWRLSKMIDANSVDTIFFNYEAACGVNTENFINYSRSFGFGPDCTNQNTAGSGNAAIDYRTSGEQSSASQMNHADEIFLKEIIWRSGKISFTNACDRKDKASEKRLNEIDVYSNPKGAYTLIKTIKPYQSYFYSNVSRYNSTDERNYRLKLDSVAFLPVDSSAQSSVYRMTYNTTKAMPGRESCAQDQWGFNNGQYSNTSMMPAQTVMFNQSYYNIGTANRSTDSLSMLSCMIKSIQYPTGGKSIFSFEPHTYPTTQSYTENKSFYLGATGGFQSSTQSTFVPDSAGSAYMITYNFSSYNYNDVSNRPKITITDQVTNQTTTYASNINPSLPLSNSSSPTPFYPVLGHTYLVVVNIYTTTNTNVFANITIAWHDTYTNIPVIGVGGGLRTKSITNVDINDRFISKDSFQYDYPHLLTPATYLLVNYENTIYRCGAFPPVGMGAGCVYLTQNSSPQSVIYHANSVYPATQFSGSHVLYGSVTKYQVDSLNNTNGKSVYQYSVFDDQSAYASTDYGKIGVLLISNNWRNGFLGWESDFKYNSTTSKYILIHEKINNYLASRMDAVAGLKVHSLYNWNTSQCYTISMSNANTEYFLVQIPTNSGAMLLQSSSDTTWDDNGNKITSTQNYFYNDLTHLLPTSIQRISSKGQTITDILKYPHDLAASGNVYQKMVSRNIISPTVQTIQQNNGIQLSLTNINYYDWFGDSKLILPQTVDHQTYSNAIETRVKFNGYDKYGNILQQQKLNDINQSYIWDYKGSLPIAETVNTAQSNTAYTSFEADGTGNWTFNSAGINSSAGFTGEKCYGLSSANTMTKTGLTGGNYIVSYWKKNGVSGTVSINSGSAGTSLTAKRGWTLYSRTLSNVTSVTITGAGAAIDEVRLYPADAQMTTYTYAPLVGMTSQCDAANRLTTYEYDGLGRLSLVRDQDNNIVKKMDYHYTGQSESSPSCACDNPSIGKRCINDQCQQGVRVNTITTRQTNGTFKCVYHWEWPNFSGIANSANIVEYNADPCFID